MYKEELGKKNTKRFKATVIYYIIYEWRKKKIEMVNNKEKKLEETIWTIVHYIFG